MKIAVRVALAAVCVLPWGLANGAETTTGWGDAVFLCSVASVAGLDASTVKPGDRKLLAVYSLPGSAWLTRVYPTGLARHDSGCELVGNSMVCAVAGVMENGQVVFDRVTRRLVEPWGEGGSIESQCEAFAF
jgi:cytosine/uracil/thiamine/allantoin permease